MKKRIEEFTDGELAKVWISEPGSTVESGMVAVLNYIKANLSTTEPMSVVEIEKWLEDGHGDAINNAPTFRRIADIIQPLTAQGLRVDWNSEVLEGYPAVVVVPVRQESADRAKVVWGDDLLQYIPRPAPKTRQMNRIELIKALADYSAEFSDEDIKEMLAKRGINTEVEA